MSAYFVEHSTIDRIISAMRLAHEIIGLSEPIPMAPRTVIGRELFLENARSVAYRYSLAGNSEQEEMEAEAKAYSYAEPSPLPTESDPLACAAILFDGILGYDDYKEFGAHFGNDGRSALGEWDYQACETEDYRNSKAYAFAAEINEMTQAAISLMLPAIKSAYSEKLRLERAAELEQESAAVAALIAQYPELVPVEHNYGGKHSAKNIRILLKKSFPGVKFSVKSDLYAVRIYWTDGPTTEKVDEIAKRFEAGHFDGMTDCYEYNKSAWNKAFGNVDYVFLERDFSDDSILFAIRSICPDSNCSVDDYKDGKLWNIYEGEHHLTTDSIQAKIGNFLHARDL